MKKCIIFLFVFALFSFLSCENEAERKLNEICDIFENGTERAKSATSSKELYDLSWEIKKKIESIDVTNLDDSSISYEEKVHAERIKQRYYSTLEGQYMKLTGHETKWRE